MKKIFIFFSTIVVALFLVFELIQQKEIIVFESYPSVDVLGSEGNKVAHKEEFNKEINTFAKDHGIVLARRIVEPNSAGVQKFTYAIYGKGDLPHFFTKANKQTIKYSDLSGSYLIVKGTISKQLLVNKFTTLGYKSVSAPEMSTLNNFEGLLNGTSLLCLVIFILTFIGLTLIYRIKDLRFAGIKLISGESLFKVSSKPVLKDLKFLVFTNVIVFLFGIVGLFFYRSLNVQSSILLFLGLAIYFVLLMLISLTLSIIYLFSLNKSNLVSLLKGKLPLKSIILSMSVAQFLSIVIVGFTLKQFVNYNDIYQEMNQAETKWKKASDRFIPTYSMTANAANKEEDAKRNIKYYDFISDAVNNHDALLCQSNLDNFTNGVTLDGIRSDEYVPEGNTIYVTPNYLDKQNIPISKKTKESLQNLKPGEFGMLIPDKLRSQESELKAKYLKDFNGMLKGSRYEHVSYKIISDFLPNDQERFLYNSSPISIVNDQFVKDPIIIVWTPTSTRNATSLYWAAALSYSINFKGYDETINLMKKHAIYDRFSQVINSRLNYLNKVNEFRTQIISLLVGSIMSLITATFMFALMNLLYFEEFRKEIFIKRISGLSFIEIHFKYLLSQLITLLIGTIGNFYLTHDLLISTFTALFFIIIGSFMMYRQAKHEDIVAVTVMKGK